MGIKIAIIGLGDIGKKRFEFFKENSEVNEVCFFDRTVEQYNAVRSVGAVKELFLDPSVDAVAICTPNAQKLDLFSMALESGKHVFCEKPPAMNVNEMLEVIKAEKITGKVLKYGFNHRFHYSVMEAKKMINKGVLGKLLWMRGIYGKAGSIDFHDNWRNYKHYSGGGILLDQGIHMLDLYRYFTGEEFECLSSHLTTSSWDIECEDNAFLTLKTNSNIFATLHSSATQWRHKFLIEMNFEEGYLNLDGILSSTRSYAPETLVFGEREFEDVTFAMGKPKESTTYYEYDKSWDLELAEFVAAIKGKSNIVNGTSKDAYEIMKLIDISYQIARTPKQLAQK